MKTPRVASALNYLDDHLISEAVDHQPKQTRRHPIKWTKWKAAAACFLLVAVIFGVLPLVNAPYSSPFVMTAYAYEGDAVGRELTDGTNVPVSVFQTTAGSNCFVFSSDQLNVNAQFPTSSISIISTGNYSEQIGEIVGMIPKAGQNYYIYVIEDSAKCPYDFSLFIPDEAKNMVCQYSVTITVDGGGYTAKLSDVKTQKMTGDSADRYVSEIGMYVFDKDGNVVLIESHPSLENRVAQSNEK